MTRQEITDFDCSDAIDLFVRSQVSKFHINSSSFDDVVSECHLLIAKRRKNFNPARSRISTFLWYVCRTSILNFLNKQKKHPLFFSDRIDEIVAKPINEEPLDNVKERKIESRFEILKKIKKGNCNGI